MRVTLSSRHVSYMCNMYLKCPCAWEQSALAKNHHERLSERFVPKLH